MWLSVGVTAGVSASVWARHRFRQALARLAPTALSRQLSGTVRGLGGDLRDALAEGRAEMDRRQAQLEARVSAGRPPAPGRGKGGRRPGTL